MKLTWGMAHKNSPVSVAVHQQIHNEVREIVYQALTQYRPSATNLRFQSIWTERMSDNQIKAHFTYSFTDEEENEGIVDQIQDGQVVLNRISLPDGDKEGTAWSLDEVMVSRQVIHFKKDVVITPSEK